MPETPDVELYLHSLNQFIGGKVLNRVIVKSPFVLRTFAPTIEIAEKEKVTGFHRIGKRIVWEMESVNLVFHLMIAGRFHWKKAGKLPNGKMDLIAFQFEHGTMMMTEASKKKRAALHLVIKGGDLNQFDRGGIDPLKISLGEFSERLQLENRTLKRALTDPRLFSGIGNAYSDEILLLACLSPLKRTHQMKDNEIKRLFDASQKTLSIWTKRLIAQTGDKFPEKVTAFRPEMMAHGKFEEKCAQCNKTTIRRIRYAENECNYCPKCQCEGKILADRSLSRLLKGEWPKTIDELEQP